MLHLTCALNAAALRSPAELADHQAEAADVAARVGSGTNFGHQGFGLVTTGSGKSIWLLSAARWQGPRVGPRNRHHRHVGVAVRGILHRSRPGACD
jgi:hypothetical protein